jgi:hypothetical protein
MILIFSIVGVVLIALLVGRIHFITRFNSQVKELFSQSQNSSRKTFQLDQLAGLPEPVQRYFNYGILPISCPANGSNG